MGPQMINAPDDFLKQNQEEYIPWNMYKVLFWVVCFDE